MAAMSDLINRQAVIDYCEALMNADCLQQTDDCGYGRERYNQTECIMQYIENMPPTEPKREKREMNILAVLLLVALAFGLGFLCGFVVGMCSF